ncbi:tetratricopeptide repeat-containing sulfotransferase family protein [Sphingomonas sp. Y38-1Y]|uniref:tetratricopeptide repeat-containing sulfotransferase family protein n=1 Tax=Sphingomonas sp. Y38-1Y TaxID=3078265 RepID=UPI0028EC807E|nr:sulfotransferase [Sphingomonas sp. Y38-1Y]
MASLDILKQALARGDRAGANDAIAALIDGRASLGTGWRSLATLAMHHGEVDLALAAMAAFVAASGDAPPARHEQAVLLARSGRLDAAEAVLAGLDDHPSVAFTRATIALDRGALEEARDLLRDLVTRAPLAGSAWLALGTAGGIDEPLGDTLLALVAGRYDTAPNERVAALHAAGGVLAARGEHDAAFAAFARAAAEHRRVLPHDRAADVANAAAATRGFDRATAGSGKGRAIFVTGMPRSGTTLVEQIVTAHSDVAGGSELNLLRLIAQDAGGTNAAAARASDRPALAALYDHLLDQRFGPGGRIVDKTLTTSRFLGLIDAVLPDSPVIWVRRDPLDTAWSCFRTHFASGAAWSLDLADIAHHMRLEDDLHARWAERLGPKLLTVDYAKLVEDPALQIARILAHCRLPDEPGPYAPQTNARAVTTSSSAQVRQPIGRFGLGVALPYRRHLEPFLKVYRNG